MNLRENGPALLVCVYYRVAAGDSDRVILAVREFQRTLPADVGATEAQVLLRCVLPLAAPSSDVPPAPLPSHDPSTSADSDADCPPEATVMETYRLVLPSGSAAADTALRSFLDTLAAAAAPIAALLHGPRHIELFAPCAS